MVMEHLWSPEQWLETQGGAPWYSDYHYCLVLQGSNTTNGGFFHQLLFYKSGW